jgi:hypothetical protein
MNNLSGWIRLWIFISGIWILMVLLALQDGLFISPNIYAYDIRNKVSVEVNNAIADTGDPKNITVKIRVLDDNVYLKPHTSDELVRQTKAEFETLAIDILRQQWGIKFFKIILASISFPAILYLFSRSVYWVWQGFRKPSNQKQ